jgi:hypothetical protein
MELMNKLSAAEDEIFAELNNIDSQMRELKEKQSKLKELAKVLNADRLRNLKTKNVKKANRVK